MAGERTEAPTPKRRQEARRKGQTVKSQDLTGAVALLAGLLAVKILAGTVPAQLSQLVAMGLSAAGQNAGKESPWTAGGVAGTLVGILLPMFLLVVIAVAGVNVVLGGATFSLGSLSPRGERISPIAGAKRLFSMHGLIQTGKLVAKFVACAAVAALVIEQHISDLSLVGTLDLPAAIKLLIDLTWELLFKTAFAFLAVGVLDWAWERRRFMNTIRMTKHEVKEELRQSEGDPRVRVRQRQKREQLMNQMLKSVRTADVLITNPTHYAVALRYDPSVSAAPLVVAKGQDYFALRLREAATEAGVPILENPPLARSLHRLVPVGSAIPAELYLAVAEILAWVYRLRNRGSPAAAAPAV